MYNLNTEQKQAVEHTGSPLLIIAGAGTGKTTVITQKIGWLIEQNLAKSDEILALTFTEKAAGEMVERVDTLLPYGYVDLWIMTFHSFCEKILQQHGLDIGLPTNFKLLNEFQQWALMKKNLDKFNLDYYRPLGNQTKFISALLQHFSRAKDEDISPTDYLAYADELKENVDSMLSGQVIKKRGNDKYSAQGGPASGWQISNITDAGGRITKEIAEQEIARINEVANAYHVYQQLLLDNSALDFGDLINYTLKLFRERPAILAKYQKQFKYILVDEFQDTNWAQYELIKLLTSPAPPLGKVGNIPVNLTMVGDDDQCLPGESLVLTKNGKKRIDNIKAGEEVATAVGRGYVSYGRVAVVKKTIKKGRFLTFTTASGHRLTVTDNHKMFCYVPANQRWLSKAHKKFYYVYLMHKQELGWRMGITNDLAVRLRLERSADRIVAAAAFATEQEARYHEVLWSLTYGIPTACFQERDGILMTSEYIKRLYQDIDVVNNVGVFARDMKIDLDAHQVSLDAVNRGNKVRIVVKLELCQRNYRSKNAQSAWLQSPLVLHGLSVETSHQPTLNILESMHLPLLKAKKGQKFQRASVDIDYLGKIAREIQARTGAIIANVMRVGTDNKQHKKAVIVPAKNVLLGMFVPVITKQGVVYEQVVKRATDEKEAAVYDLEVEKTHNFIANGVVVHNSIFRFRGASMSNILQFKKDYPNASEVLLTQNYRSAQNILDTAYNFIQLNNPNRLEVQLQSESSSAKAVAGRQLTVNSEKGLNKKLVSSVAEQGMIEIIQGKDLQDEVNRVIEKIVELKNADKDSTWNDFAILVRANNSAKEFVNALEIAGWPYVFLASRGLYSRPVIMDIIAYLNLLDNYHESTAMYRVLNIPVFKFSHEEIIGFLNLARKKSWSLYEAIKYLANFSESSGEKIKILLTLIDKHTALIKTKKTSEIIFAFLGDSGYLKYLEALEPLKTKETMRELNAFLKRVKEFEAEDITGSVKNFLQELSLELESGEEGSLAQDPEAGPEMIKILTVHAAKGLEFKYVFIVNMVDLRFPTTERKDPIAIPDALVKEIIPEGDSHLEEERRLFYVAMTRAKSGLYFSWAKDYGGQRRKKPSRFLQEAKLITHNAQRITQDTQQDEGKKIVRGNVVSVGSTHNSIYELSKFYSYTQLQSYDKCPHQYFIDHILKIPKPGKHFFSFGQTMHLALQKFFGLVLSSQNSVQADLFGQQTGKSDVSKILTLETLLKLYEESWIDDWYEDKKQKEEYRKKGKGILKEFFARHNGNWPKVIGLEQGFRLRIGGYPIYGKIDRVDDLGESGVQIVDYKTGQAKDEEKITSDQKYQLLLYQLAATEVLKRKPANLQFYYLERNSELNFLGSPDEITKMQEWVITTIHKIEESIKRDYFPHSSDPCRYCNKSSEVGSFLNI